MKDLIRSSPVVRWTVLALVAAAAFAVTAVPAAAKPNEKRPSFSVAPGDVLEPRFAWRKPDYVARCAGKEPTLKIKGMKGWRSKVGPGGFRPGGYSKPLRRRAGKRTTVVFRRANREARRQRFHIRCLPADFPGYDFTRTRKGGPSFFTIQMENRYAVIVNGDGVPVWWYQAKFDPYNVELQPDGTISWDPVDDVSFLKGNYEVRTLTGRLLRVVSAGAGELADVHELILLKNGNYLLGQQAIYKDDTSAFGGSADSDVLGFEIQEITPDGDVAYRWRSRDHIAVEETPQRWWDQPILNNEPYDTSHWNSVELFGRGGKYMLLSFRHLDAVYKINRETGNIVWKLGGTETPRSLEVIGDPYGDGIPLGGQHDARVLPNGTVTIYDNRTALPDPPRVNRYRIDEDAGTATLVQSFEDPEVPNSICCGSARRLPAGEWLVGWGGVGTVGAYDRTGERIFKFTLDTNFSYRAVPIADGAVSARRLRRGMDAIADR